MDLDPFSPVAPARIKIVLVPIGDVKQSRFRGFVQRLRPENIIRLGDVSPDSRPHRTMFSPLAFPEGQIVFEMSTSFPPSSHLALSPFELYRQPLLVLGVTDGGNIHVIPGQEDGQPRTKKKGGNKVADEELKRLAHSLEDLKSDFPMGLVHQLLVFDCAVDSGAPSSGLMFIPPLAKSKTTTVRTIMCDLTSNLLAEMTTYAKSLQGLSSLDTPKDMSDLNGPQDVASSVPAHMAASSRPTSAAERSRSFSPAGDRSRSNYRMSMPVDLPFNINSRSSTPGSRNASPAPGTLTPPATDTNGTSQITSPPRKSSNDKARGDSKDRVSTSGFGPGSLGERDRNRGKARIGVVVGAMYLLAGQWPDAIKELVQSTTAARASSDYVWQARALDYILVCLLMCAWAGVDFRIPDLLRPGAERSSTGSSKSSSHTQTADVPYATASKTLDPAKHDVDIQTLAGLLPDVVNTIMNLYSRAWTFTEDKMPPLAFSHSTTRFAKLLTAINASHGYLKDGVLNHFVLNSNLPRRAKVSSDIASFPSKPEIVALLLRAYPPSSPERSLSVADRTNILAALASVLSDLGHQRKKALILKELLSTLLPALVQARKDGAAEMGVHPAASLASLTPMPGTSPATGLEARRSEQGMRDFLLLVCQSYGIVLPSPNNSSKSTSSHAAEDSILTVLQQASRNASGPQDLKIDILRSCINICEALPDLAGALQYSAELLRTAGSCLAPGPESSNGSPVLPIEEQVRLANNISRTLSAAQHLGLKHPEAEYWDEFLVRGIEVMDVSSSKNLISHAKSELEIVETIDSKKEKNPFIYNPFLKSNALAAAEPMLVAKEETLFRLILQNLYDFDLTIERIRIEAQGVAFECPVQSTMIGPYRTQTIILSGMPQGPGSLKIGGCTAKIRGCRERSFSIFSQPWTLREDAKGRNLQANAAPPPNSASEPPGKPNLVSIGPKATTLDLNVLGRQPVVVVKEISLPQSALMLLEGETESFSITLQNMSRTTPVDLLLLSFTDSTTAKVQAALASKKLSALELYELELASAHKPSFRWHRKEENRDVRVAPGGEVTVEIEVRGKAGLSHGTVQVDYGYLGIPKDEIAGNFYTRQLTVPLTVTVNASVDLVRNDLVPFAKELNWHHQENIPSKPNIPSDEKTVVSQPNKSVKANPAEDLLTSTGFSSTTQHTLLLLDFRNSWPSALTLTLQTGPPPTSPSGTISHTLTPGTTTRIPLPLPKIYLPSSTAHAPIPSLNQANKRQFIVSTTKPTPSTERTLRESFWYREELLKQLSATWKDDSTGRSGTIELRGLKLNTRMISAYKLNDIAISMHISLAHPPPFPGHPTIQHPSPTTFTTPTLTPLTLHTNLHNISPLPIRPLLRLQPSLANQPPGIALDLSKKLLVSGVLQRSLPALGPGEEREVETGFLVLARGVYEWGACVEEVGRWETLKVEGGGEGLEEGRRWWGGGGVRVFARDIEGWGWEGGDGDGREEAEDGDEG